MSEKRGETVKLIDNYNTAGVLEVKMGKTWYRTTSKDFRSFDGPRRITEPTEVRHRNVDIPLRMYEYHGPVYMYGTNYEVEPKNTGKIVQSEVWEAARIKSESRRD
jgi:hypothetical protein|tara:strand:+ start:728 stop:1045 length:318 start_codon:yes stop_codon:yes gene_type:complete